MKKYRNQNLESEAWNSKHQYTEWGGKYGRVSVYRIFSFTLIKRYTKDSLCCIVNCFLCLSIVRLRVRVRVRAHSVSKCTFCHHQSVYCARPDWILFRMLVCACACACACVGYIHWTKTTLDMCIALNCHTNIVLTRFDRIWICPSPTCTASNAEHRIHRAVRQCIQFSTVFKLATGKWSQSINW